MPTPSLKSINVEAGTNFKRWKELTEAVRVEWHPQIYRPAAQKDGLTPDDFTWLDYPVSNVRLEHPQYGDSSQWNLRYFADIPPDTPQLNLYDSAGNRLPEPRGSALATVNFSLIDTADGEVLHQYSSANHVDGQVDGGLTNNGRKLWERLTPPGNVIDVKVEAFPRFFPYNNPDTGDGGNHYNVGGRGYCWGSTATSPTYRLELTQNHALLIDGQPAPTDPETPEHSSIAEGDRIMAEERAAREAQEERERRRMEEERRLHEAQLERERLMHEAEQQRQREAAEREQQRREQEREAERQRAAQAAAGVREYTLLDRMRDGLRNKPDNVVANILGQMVGVNAEYEAAARAYAAERGIAL